jgi:hypothetical protein
MRHELPPSYRPELPVVALCTAEGCTALVSPRFGGGRTRCSEHRRRS